MNTTYTKGTGDFTPPATNEPTDEQIILAIRNNPQEVARNAREYFGMELESALFSLAKFDDIEPMRDVLNKSAVDLLECGLV